MVELLWLALQLGQNLCVVVVAAESKESAGSPSAEEFASLGWDSPALEIGRALIDMEALLCLLPTVGVDSIVEESSDDSVPSLSD